MLSVRGVVLGLFEGLESRTVGGTDQAPLEPRELFPQSIKTAASFGISVLMCWTILGTVLQVQRFRIACLSLVPSDC